MSSSKSAVSLKPGKMSELQRKEARFVFDALTANKKSDVSRALNDGRILSDLSRKVAQKLTAKE